MEAATSLVVGFIHEVVDPVLAVLFAIGFLMFVFGLLKFMYDMSEGKNRQEGIQTMIWGVVGMFIMSSGRAIIAIIDNTFQLGVLSGTAPSFSDIQSSLDNIRFF